MEVGDGRRVQLPRVADGVARRLVREVGQPFLTESLDRFDRLVRAGVLVVKKSKAAALIHLIQNPDEYPYPNAAPSVRSPAPSEPSSKAARMEPLLALPSVREEFLDLDPTQAAEKALGRLGVHYRKLLSVSELDRLRHAIVQGRLDAAELLDEAMGAVARLEKETFAQRLRAQLPAD